MKVKEESEKAGLIRNIQKDHSIRSHHFVANNGETMETVTDFIFLGSKIIVNSGCSHEIKTLLLRRKAMTNLDSLLKSRNIT